MGFDRAMLQLMVDHRTGWLTALTRTVAEVGMSTSAYVAAAVLCVVFGLVLHAWRTALAAPLAAVVAIAVADVTKGLIGRPRPPGDMALLTSGSFSMPSSIGALTAGAAVPVILYGLHRADAFGRVLAVVLLLATVSVGVSMVYLGAHWATDVLVGWALGTAIGAAVFWALAGRRRQRVPAGR